MIEQALDIFSEKALSGFTFAGVRFDSAEECAAEARRRHKELDDQISWLVRHSIMQAAALGAVTSVGGILALPITLPANIVTTSVVQLRMCYAIALLTGYNSKDPQTRACVQMVAFGMLASDILKDLAVKALVPQVVKLLSAQIAAKAATRVATKTLQKAATRAATRWIPVVSAVIGATIDGTVTWMIAKQARALFQVQQPDATP